MRAEKNIWNEKPGYWLENGTMQVFVNPEDGMNIYQINWKGKSITAWDEKRFAKKATYGIPVFYPTPNRSKDSRITANGKLYDARLHGVVRNLPFEVITVGVEDEVPVLTGSVCWDKRQPDFSMFPFPAVLSITIRVLRNEVEWSYELVNQGKEPLPYGIAIHPFFAKRGQAVKLSVPAASVMEMTEEKIPTGRLIPVEGTGFDLRSPVLVDGLDLDHVYTDCQPGACAELFFEDCKLSLKATEEFGHIVVNTPDAPFFCVENQSCSTDCFNLSAKGFVREAGLLTVAVGKRNLGAVRFLFEKV